MATTPDINSKRTRVEPIFGWLRDHGDSGWPGDLLGLADGLNVRIETGELESVSFEEEVQVAASPTRLAWMIRNAEGLARSMASAGANSMRASSTSPSANEL